ncbi:MAG: glycosyltransferase family 39 protein, partial [Bryobacteraceae bacterium]|nr:glycosyltransferase family 39 protein [Bryobacteraceae bacterium]
MNSAQILAFLSRRALLISTLLVLIATLRIAATYSVFSHTSDEPAHIACGMEWLSKGTYRYEAQHPPLTRVMAAIGPFLDGARTTGHEDFMAEGLILLRGQSPDSYERRLALARMGILPLFWIACLAVFLLGKRALGHSGAVLAVLVFTMLPVVLAHAGLATTDMGAAAFFSLSLYSLYALIDEPGIKRGLLSGAALAGMVLSKFSTLAFLSAALLFCAVQYWRTEKPSGASLKACARRLAAPALLSLLITVLLVWAAYRFSFGPAPYVPFPAPFPELAAGLKQVAEHNAKGHLSYFLGETSMSGSWLFFPVVLLVKTPLAVLALAAVSLFMARPKAAGAPARFVWTVIAAVLAVAMTANINIGLRHILPLMPFLAVAAASGLLVLFEKAGRSRWPQDAALALIVLLAGSSIMAHPDYLPYFNL